MVSTVVLNLKEEGGKEEERKGGREITETDEAHIRCTRLGGSLVPRRKLQIFCPGTRLARAHLFSCSVESSLSCWHRSSASRKDTSN